MKTTISLITLFVATHISFMAYAASGEPSEKLLDAIRMVESGGRADAVGDGGNAVGAYQIWPCVIIDVNDRWGTKYTLKDRYNEKKSREIARLYLKRYGKGRTQLEMARIFNGGPRGHKKKATLKYAQKIEREMKK